MKLNFKFFSDFEKKSDGRTDGRADGRTDGRTDGRADGRTGGRTDAGNADFNLQSGKWIIAIHDASIRKWEKDIYVVS